MPRKKWVSVAVPMEAELVQLIDRLVEQLGLQRATYIKLILKNDLARRGYLPEEKALGIKAAANIVAN
jgi:hypothetical protein